MFLVLVRRSFFTTALSWKLLTTHVSNIRWERMLNKRTSNHVQINCKMCTFLDQYIRAQICSQPNKYCILESGNYIMLYFQCTGESKNSHFLFQCRWRRQLSKDLPSELFGRKPEIWKNAAHSHHIYPGKQSASKEVKKNCTSHWMLLTYGKYFKNSEFSLSPPIHGK